MPSYLNSARIKKPGHPNNSRRQHSSSPFNTTPRTKPPSNQRTKSLEDALHPALDHGNDENPDERLPNPSGTILTTTPMTSITNVLAAIQHSHATMFEPVPERAGMNSVRIAEVLNFRKSLPALASLAHVHALLSASSKTEREISNLLDEGKIRRITVMGRGNDVSGTSDFLVSIVDLESSLTSSGFSSEIRDSFLAVLKQNPRATTIPSPSLPAVHISALTRAGFLVFIPASLTRNVFFTGSKLVSTRTISRAHSGSSAAVGGQAAFEELGGTGHAHRPGSQPQQPPPRAHDKRSSREQAPLQPPRPSRPPLDAGGAGELALSLPSIGTFIRLLHSSRTHLLDLLSKSNLHREIPLSILRERWDGAVDDDSSSVSQAKRARGEFSEVLPAKTKKWRNLYGVSFDWVLQETLGAGMVECFDTGSVGLGIRAI